MPGEVDVVENNDRDCAGNVHVLLLKCVQSADRAKVIGSKDRGWLLREEVQHSRESPFDTVLAVGDKAARSGESVLLGDLEIRVVTYLCGLEALRSANECDTFVMESN